MTTPVIKNVYLVRHGKVQGASALNGVTDVLVDDVLQKKISARLHNYPVDFDRLVSSPLRRCSDLGQYYIQDLGASCEGTLQPNQLASAKGVDQPPCLEIVQDIQEMNFGEVDGIPFDQLTEQWDKLEQFWQAPADHCLIGAESLQQFNTRVAESWHTLSQNQATNTLVITHGGVIRMILAHCLNVDWTNPSWYANLSIENASVTHIQITQIKGDQYFNIKSIGVPLL